MSIANELITRGWTQGAFAREDGSVCLLGAIDAAGGECEIANAVYEVFDRHGIPWTIGHWNDAPGRTFDEVLRVAKEADEILDALS